MISIGDDGDLSAQPVHGVKKTQHTRYGFSDRAAHPHIPLPVVDTTKRQLGSDVERGIIENRRVRIDRHDPRHGGSFAPTFQCDRFDTLTSPRIRIEREHAVLGGAAHPPQPWGEAVIEDDIDRHRAVVRRTRLPRFRIADDPKSIFS